jgi:hypothetical protein
LELLGKRKGKFEMERNIRATGRMEVDEVERNLELAYPKNLTLGSEELAFGGGSEKGFDCGTAGRILQDTESNEDNGNSINSEFNENSARWSHGGTAGEESRENNNKDNSTNNILEGEAGRGGSDLDFPNSIITGISGKRPNENTDDDKLHGKYNNTTGNSGTTINNNNNNYNDGTTSEINGRGSEIEEDTTPRHLRGNKETNKKARREDLRAVSTIQKEINSAEEVGGDVMSRPDEEDAVMAELERLSEDELRDLETPSRSSSAGTRGTEASMNVTTDAEGRGQITYTREARDDAIEVLAWLLDLEILEEDEMEDELEDPPQAEELRNWRCFPVTGREAATGGLTAIVKTKLEGRVWTAHVVLDRTMQDWTDWQRCELAYQCGKRWYWEEADDPQATEMKEREAQRDIEESIEMRAIVDLLGYGERRCGISWGRVTSILMKRAKRGLRRQMVTCKNWPWYRRSHRQERPPDEIYRAMERTRKALGGLTAESGGLRLKIAPEALTQHELRTLHMEMKMCRERGLSKDSLQAIFEKIPLVCYWSSAHHMPAEMKPRSGKGYEELQEQWRETIHWAGRTGWAEEALLKVQRQALVAQMVIDGVQIDSRTDYLADGGVIWIQGEGDTVYAADTTGRKLRLREEDWRRHLRRRNHLFVGTELCGRKPEMGTQADQILGGLLADLRGKLKNSIEVGTVADALIQWPVRGSRATVQQRMSQLRAVVETEEVKETTARARARRYDVGISSDKSCL